MRGCGEPVSSDLRLPDFGLQLDDAALGAGAESHASARPRLVGWEGLVGGGWVGGHAPNRLAQTELVFCMLGAALARLSPGWPSFPRDAPARCPKAPRSTLAAGWHPGGTARGAGGAACRQCAAGAQGGGRAVRCLGGDGGMPQARRGWRSSVRPRTASELAPQAPTPRGPRTRSCRG